MKETVPLLGKFSFSLKHFHFSFPPSNKFSKTKGSKSLVQYSIQLFYPTSVQFVQYNGFWMSWLSWTQFRCYGSEIYLFNEIGIYIIYTYDIHSSFICLIYSNRNGTFWFLCLFINIYDLVLLRKYFQSLNFVGMPLPKIA